MKTTNTSIKFAKTLPLMVIILSSAIILSSCKKDNNTQASAISDDEVAEAVTESVDASSGGVVTQTETTAVMARTSNLTCGGSSDTTIVSQNLSGAAITYNYTLNFNRSLVCAYDVPSQFDFNFTGKSSYAAAKMSSADNSTAQFVVTGLEPSATSYVFNESYVRNGTQQSDVHLQRSFSSKLTITSTDITVSKSTQKIISGTATVQFTGSITGGAGFNRGGTITFLGDGKATVVLDNGNSYSIQW